MRIKLDEGAKVPVKGTPRSAAYDMYANESISIPPNTIRLVGTGVYMEIPKGYCGILTHRSGMNIKGAFAYGTIDCDFRGEIKVILFNNSRYFLKIEKGQRVAQIRFVKAETTDFEVVKELTKTQRNGGFGSTGI